MDRNNNNGDHRTQKKDPYIFEYIYIYDALNKYEKVRLL